MPETVTFLCDRGCGRGIVYLASDQNSAKHPTAPGLGVCGYRCLPCREEAGGNVNASVLANARKRGSWPPAKRAA